MWRPLVALLPAVGFIACSDPGTTYTLYRSDRSDTLRIHVATFDAKQKSIDGSGSAEDAYNSENCRIAADLFQSQPGVKVRYWCEKGSFKG